MFKRLNVLAILIGSIFLLIIMFGSLFTIAEAQTQAQKRSASWHETQYGTDAWGGTWVMGQFGPDVGYGEQGQYMQYTDPRTGTYVEYSSTGMGMGAGGPLMGYGGMFSPVAQASYGPYAGGGRPTVGSTPGYDTQGYLSGNLWGQSTSYYQARQNPMASLMFGLMGMFGGGGYGGGYAGGYGGASAYGGYGASAYGGYGPSAYGGYGPSAFGGGFGGSFSPFGSFGGSYGYPQRIY